MLACENSLENRHEGSIPSAAQHKASMLVIPFQDQPTGQPTNLPERKSVGGYEANIARAF